MGDNNGGGTHAQGTKHDGLTKRMRTRPLPSCVINENNKI